MKPIGEVIKEKNIQLDSIDPVLQEGFTQIPNFIQRSPNLTPGAKVAYGLFLSYAWHNDFCFPGQDRLAEDMGMSRSRVTTFVGELQKIGLISILRRGLGKTNNYTLHFQVKWNKKQKPSSKHPEVCGQTTRGQPADFFLYKNIQIKNMQYQQYTGISGPFLIENTMQTPQSEFMQWLEAMLTDDTRRAILRALLERYELPVIEIGQTATR